MATSEATLFGEFFFLSIASHKKMRQVHREKQMTLSTNPPMDAPQQNPSRSKRKKASWLRKEKSTAPIIYLPDDFLFCEEVKCLKEKIPERRRKEIRSSTYRV